MKPTRGGRFISLYLGFDVLDVGFFFALPGRGGAPRQASQRTSWRTPSATITAPQIRSAHALPRR